MANHDDVFNDFEDKVTGKKPFFKLPKKEESEIDVLKRKYEEEKRAIRQKYIEEERALEEKKHKEMFKKGHIPTKNLKGVERFAYIGIIAVLLLYIAIDLSFYHGGSTASLEEAKSTGESEAVLSSGADAEEEITPVVVEVKETKTEPVPVKTDTKAATYSGILKFGIDKVSTRVNEDQDDLGYIDEVSFIIENDQAKSIIPIVNVYIYDTELDEVWETMSRGSYSFSSIAPGETKKGTVKITPKTFRNLDVDKTVRLVINDTKTGITKFSVKTVSIS